MSSKKRGTASKPAKSKLTYNDHEVPEGSALYQLFTRLSGLGEREISGADFFIDLLLSTAAANRKIGQMQAQLDRIEGRIVELVKSCAPGPKAQQAQAASAATPKKTSAKSVKKPSRAAKAEVSQELAEIEETVEQRQARMAKMEKDEKRKAIALKKKQEELKAKKETEKKQEEKTGPKAEPKKKRPRRKRKTAIPKTS